MRLGLASLSAGPLAASIGCGSSSSPASPSVARSFTISGQLLKTFLGGPLIPAAVSIGASSQQSSDGNYSITGLAAGSYDLTITGGQFRRIRHLNLNGDISLDIDAIPNGHSFNVTHYRELCMGLNSPQPNGGNPINPGQSVRSNSGIVPHIYVVKDSRVTQQTYYDAFDTARSIFSQMSGGLITNSFIEYVNTDPGSAAIEGSIVVTFGQPFRTFASRNGFYLSRNTMSAPIGTVGDVGSLIRTIEHEYCHAIGFDHSNDATSLMNPLTIPASAPSADDIAAATLKYKRNGGHVLDGTNDSD